MSNIFSRLGGRLARPFLPPPVDPRLLMSDATGFTGQGPLVDPQLNDAIEGDQPLPEDIRQIPQSAFPQNGGNRTLPRSAFPATGESQPQQPASQLPPTDPYIEQLRRQASEAAPQDHPSTLRRILGTVASMTPAAPFAGMIEHGPGFLQRQNDWTRGQQQLPERLKIEELASRDRDRAAQDADRDEARKYREFQQGQAQQGRQDAETEKFLGRGGDFRSPQEQNLQLDPMQAPQQDPNIQGPPLPPSLSNLPPQQSAMSQLPKRIQIPVQAQLGSGERIEPGMPYDPRGSTRVGVTASEMARRKAEALRGEAQAAWVTAPPELVAKGYPSRMPAADLVKALNDNNNPAKDDRTTDYKNYEFSKKEGFKGTFEDWQNQDANRKRPLTGPLTSSLPGLENVPAHLAAPAAAAYSKSGVAYADAAATADEIQNVIDLVRSGNKAAGSNLPLLGVGALNAINGIKRMNSAEINQYQGAGSLWDQIIGKTSKLVEGQPIPADVLNDIETLHKRLAEGALKKHTAEVQAINQSHGSTFKPIKLPERQAAVDPKVKAYADQYFGGDVAKAQAAIASQKKK